MAQCFTDSTYTIPGGRYQSALEPIASETGEALSDTDYRAILRIRAAYRNEAPTLPVLYRFLDAVGVVGTINTDNRNLILIDVTEAPSIFDKWLIETLMPLAAGRRCRVRLV